MASDSNITSSSGNLTSLADIIADCNKNGPHPIRLPVQVIVLIFALPANAVLLCLLLKNIKTLTSSEVLGLNFAVLGVLFCSFGLTSDIAFSAKHVRSSLSQRFINSLQILTYFSCMLLLTCMCLERYIAVSHPVLFMKLGNWKYRAACSAVIWMLTCVVAALTFVYTIAVTALPLSVFINIMFLAMLACLLGIVRVLRKKGPGDGEQANSPIKKRALKNILAVLIPSTIIYSPMLGLAPFLVIIQLLAQKGTNSFICGVLQMFGTLPNFGVCIGPMFYMARVRQILCRGNNVRDAKQTATDLKK